MPSSAALMLAAVPVKVIVLSAVPSPTVKLRPTSCASVKVPSLTARVICRSAPPTSRSLTEIRLPFRVEKTSEASSFMLCADGTVLSGASLTALTVMPTVSVSVNAPPEPVLPWSSVVSVRVTAPLKSAFGSNDMPSSAALMLAAVPVNVIVLSALPSPTVKLRPSVCARVKVPSLTPSVTCRSAPPTSRSLTEIRLPFRMEKTSEPSSSTFCATGTVLSGASFTALTVMPTVSVSASAPPEPVFPWSSVARVRVTAPLKSAFGSNDIPSSAALMLAAVPVNVIVLSAVPSPTVKLRPTSCANVKVPSLTARVICRSAPPTSRSLTEIWLPFSVEKTSKCCVLVRGSVPAAHCSAARRSPH